MVMLLLLLVVVVVVVRVVMVVVQMVVAQSSAVRVFFRAIGIPFAGRRRRWFSARRGDVFHGRSTGPQLLMSCIAVLVPYMR